MGLSSSKRAVLIVKAPGLLAKACFCCATALGMTVFPAREVAGVTMPAVISGPDVNLVLNGMRSGARRSFSKPTSLRFT